MKAICPPLLPVLSEEELFSCCDPLPDAVPEVLPADASGVFSASAVDEISSVPLSGSGVAFSSAAAVDSITAGVGSGTVSDAAIDGMIPKHITAMDMINERNILQ